MESDIFVLEKKVDGSSNSYTFFCPENYLEPIKNKGFLGKSYLRHFDQLPKLRIYKNKNEIPLQVIPKKDAGLTHDARLYYALESHEDSTFTAELKPNATTQQFLIDLGKEENWERHLHQFPIIQGDSFWIPAGRVFAYQGESSLLEIATPQNHCLTCFQQNKQLLEEKIDFKNRKMPRFVHDSKPITQNRKIPLTPTFGNFLIEELRLLNLSHESTRGEAHLIIPLEYELKLISRQYEQTINLSKLEPAFIPEKTMNYSISSDSPQRILKIRLP